MREALERLKASSMTSSSIRFSLTGGQVGWTTNTSAPRTLSWIWNQISPSLKRARCARPSGTPEEAGDGFAQRGVRASGEDPQLPRDMSRAHSRPRPPGTLAGAEGFEPSNTGFKAPRLNRLATPQAIRYPGGLSWLSLSAPAATKSLQTCDRRHRSEFFLRARQVPFHEQQQERPASRCDGSGTPRSTKPRSRRAQQGTRHSHS